MPENNQTLLEAVKANNVARVKELLTEGVALDAVDVNGRTALHLAATINATEIAILLLDAQIPIDAPMSNGSTALFDAVAWGHDEMVTVFLARGASTAIVDEYDLHVLHYAIDHGRQKCAQLLIQHSPKLLETPTANGYLPIHCLPDSGASSTKDTVALARFLKEHHVEFNCQTKYGDTVLHLAAEAGDFELVKTLVGMGCKISVHNNAGYSPRKTAQRCGHDEVAEFLRDKILHRQRRVQTKFFDLDRSQKKSTEKLMQQFYRARTEHTDKTDSIDIRDKSARKVVMADAGAVKFSLKGVDEKRLTTQDKIAKKTKWSNVGYSESKKANANWSREYLQVSPSLTVCSQYKPQAGHLANFLMNGIGDYGEGVKGSSRSVLTIIYDITNKSSSEKTRKENEKKLARILLTHLKTGEPMTQHDFQSFKKPPARDELNRLMRLLVLTGIKETTRRMHSHFRSDGTSIKELPIAIAYLQALRLIADGHLAMKEVFAKDAKYGLPTASQLQNCRVLAAAETKLAALNELYSKRYETGFSREDMHQLLLEGYGGESESDGDAYETSDDESATVRSSSASKLNNSVR